MKRAVIFLFVFLITNDFAFAQDSIVPKEPPHLYENIETYSERTGFTKFMFRLFFKPVSSAPAQKMVNKRLKQKPYKFFEGKIIRQINIVTLDPFGNSIGDTISGSLNFLSKAGNKFHLKTRSKTIRNLLLIREKQPFDSLRVKESERLVRSMNYITDVSFYTIEVPGTTDSVDIFIRELDSWSLIPGGSRSDSRLTIKLREDNFIGLGHSFQNAMFVNRSSRDIAHRMKYFIPNISNTFINSTLQYGTDEYGDFIKTLGVERPFFSPLAMWAGGINFAQHHHKNSIWTANFMPYKFNAQDYWLGNSVPVFRGNSEYSRTTRFISALRFKRVRFIEQPPETIDTLQFYKNENFFLAGIGISTRLYIKDKYIFKFGITEDVPIGKVVGLTGGYQQKNSFQRFYVGARFSWGNYHPWGYMSSNIEYGTYFRSSRAEQSVFRIGANYFTGLIEIGQWKFRQFIKPQVIIGSLRTDYDSLTINNEYGLRGFNSPVLTGTSRLLFTSQTQAYAPWNFIGFHFGPYLNFSLGMLGDAENGFRKSKLYSQIGLGILIKNDNLVMNAFQLSISFYPVIPGLGTNILKTNSFQTTDFGFRDFEIGKPDAVEFR
ncbi:hypothetical protein [Marinilabilia salmonicolor]|jgi:hypothetical protein|uniref:Surface antigen-like variable number repeat protein n=1 Tax=Marinilabilia salmonicolor TaxID=989 RepID=A0A2T0XH91_9BACT|nr:hypothetical protein [Marinilabilia salmonicolor]PRY98267.1 hypothetical protein BY457_11079 [Marinilabilia salmonicolor]RCW33841.1 hypothetical protein DFO77_1123 [Marinilabilia salmonicolor]